MHKIIVKNLEFILDSGESLFSGVSFSLEKGDKVGVIGRNGSGKTTLLKILSGQVDQTKGSVQVSKKVYYLPQQKDSSDEKTKNLSGGEFIRYHLDQAKKINPDVLLLDEPTNHLDDVGRVILQLFINSYDGILIFVSHDIDFLEKNSTKILSFWDRKLIVFGGNYTEYKEYFKEFLEGIERQKSALKKEEKKLKEAYQIEQVRSQRVIQKNRKLKSDGSMGGLEKGFFKDQSQFAHGKIKAQIEKLQNRNRDNQVKYELPQDLDVSFIFPATSNKKSLLVKVENENLAIGNKELIRNYNFEIYYGEKVLLRGENGSGKSVFVNSLKKYFKENIQVACLDQFYNLIDKQKTILENVLENSPDIQVARKVLSLYGFPDAHIIGQRADCLSGGEMCRLALAKISVVPLDLIILDEPTNNIDIETKEVLLNSLKKFKGALLIISHDKNFVGNLGVDRALMIKDMQMI